MTMTTSDYRTKAREQGFEIDDDAEVVPFLGGVFVAYDADNRSGLPYSGWAKIDDDDEPVKANTDQWTWL